MSGMAIRHDYIWIHVAKTGSTTVTYCLKEVEKYFHGPDFEADWTYISYDHDASPDRIPREYRHFPVVTTMRNPYTWYVSYWNHNHYREPDGLSIAGYDDFNTWVSENSSFYQSLYIPSVPENATLYTGGTSDRGHVGDARWGLFPVA